MFPDKPAPGWGSVEGGKDTHRYLISSSNGFSAEIRWGFLPAKVYRRLKDLFGQGRRPFKARSPPNHRPLPGPFAQLLHTFSHLAACLQFMCVRTHLCTCTGYTQMCVWLGYVWWGVGCHFADFVSVLCSSRNSRSLNKSLSFLVLFKPLECPFSDIFCILSFIKWIAKTTSRKKWKLSWPSTYWHFSYQNYAISQ